MHERLPPRREPRLLVLDATTRPPAYVALDPWELRGLGRLPRAGPVAALTKLVLQVHPSHLVVLGTMRALAPALAAIERRGIARLVIDRPSLDRARKNAPDPIALEALYPELRCLARTPKDAELVALAGTGFVLLATHSRTPRRYAGNPLRPAPAVDA